MITFEASVRIERPIDEVFAYVCEPALVPAVELCRPDRAPRFGGERRPRFDVLDAVDNYRPARSRTSSRSSASEPPTKFGIRTTSGPTPFLYDYRFAPDGPGTVVHLEASVELPGATAILGPLAARGVRRGVDANLAALRTALEASARRAQPPQQA